MVTVYDSNQLEETLQKGIKKICINHFSPILRNRTFRDVEITILFAVPIMDVWNVSGLTLRTEHFAKPTLVLINSQLKVKINDFSLVHLINDNCNLNLMIRNNSIAQIDNYAGHSNIIAKNKSVIVLEENKGFSKINLLDQAILIKTNRINPKTEISKSEKAQIINQ